MDKKKGKSRKRLLVAAGLFLLAGGIAAIQLLLPKEEVDEILWREYKASMGSITASLDSGGKLENAPIEHSFMSEVKLSGVHVEVGDTVAKGDILAQYDKTELEKKVQDLKRELGTARRSLQDAVNTKEKTLLQDELNKDNSGYERWSEYQRKRRELQNSMDSLEEKISMLQERIATLEQELADAEAGTPPDSEKIAGLREQLRQVRADLKASQQDRSAQEDSFDHLVKDHKDKSEQNKSNQSTQDKIDALTAAGLDNAIKNAETEVQKLEASLAAATRQLATVDLIAEQDGVVVKLGYASGETVPAGKAVVTIGETQQKRAITQVPQEDIGRVEIGQRVELQFLARPDETLSGTVLKKRLTPTEGGDGVRYQVTIALENAPDDLLEGMTCGVKFILKKVENVITLSNKAITLRDGKQFVTVLGADGSREEREIKTGFSDGRTSEIKSGLADGDTVVVAG